MSKIPEESIITEEHQDMCISAAEHQDESLRRASHRKEDKAHIAAQLGDTQGRAFAIHGRHLRLDRVDMPRLHDLKPLPRDRPYAFDAPSSTSPPTHPSLLSFLFLFNATDTVA